MRSIYTIRPHLIFVLFLLIAVNTNAQEDDTIHAVEIPEPLMFDLVRGLGARQGELEINALADFPLNDAKARGVEWAPEIEYAVFNNFAVELEFPMQDWELEAYKVAVQWTIGNSSNNKFIHGIQVIGETFIHEDLLEVSLLYVPAYRFSEVWSAIGLFGVMLESGDDKAEKDHTILLNASVFADLNEHTAVGLEINNSDPTFQGIDNNEMELLILPQVHREYDNGFSFQFGAGSKFFDGGTDFSAVLRVIQTF
ncbi:hypothetical protein [Robertkochia sediminum]|uniref:hypothetical protein n=1 Tax=Robertkochia sediminum TaxID=2785326 RepID=UPI00193488C8|nr:hypothetical protein [Robertkochia sediminum]MBL7472563.1 hypothetical protein [Robertkochia sediminum]